MKICNKCGRTYPDTTKFCSVCGLSLSPFKEKKKHNGLMVVAIVFLIIMILALIAAIAILGVYKLSNKTGSEQGQTEVTAQAETSAEADDDSEDVTEATTEEAVTTEASTYAPSTTEAPSSTTAYQSATQSDFVFPDFSSEYIQESQVRQLSDDQIQLAINEICAWRGRKFNSEKWQNYFGQFSWYEGVVDPEVFDSNISGYLNKYELYNYTLLMNVRDEQ